AASTTILSGGLQVVEGLASGTTVLGGGEMVVSSGGVTDGATIDSGGTLVVLSGGIDGGDPALNMGDSIVMNAIPTTVRGGGTEILMGTATSATLDSGAVMIGSSGGGAEVHPGNQRAAAGARGGGERS